MPSARIAIVGGGFSGSYAAWLLTRAGLQDHVALEARDAPGGRIASFAPPARACGKAGAQANGTDRFDLGPTWFWSDVQPELDRLVHALGLARFGQFEAGRKLTL